MSKTIELTDGTPHTFTDEELERGEAMMARLREVEASLVDDTGQTAYSEQLLPCPFCGGRAWIQYWPYPDDMGYEAREVARRLRSFVTDDSVYADVDACRVLHSIGLYYKDIDRIYFSGFDVARLADLIEPSEPKVCVGCDDDTCLGFSGLGWLYDSDKEATEAWNRRAGRTCNVESSHVEQEIGDYSYLEVELSCGHAFTWDDGTPPDYCPYCGARIIREETGDAD